MKATKGYYLQHRNRFIRMGFNQQVCELDIIFNVNFLLNRDGKVLMIM